VEIGAPEATGPDGAGAAPAPLPVEKAGSGTGPPGIGAPMTVAPEVPGISNGIGDPDMVQPPPGLIMPSDCHGPAAI
jgi:hypothetical protein